MTVLSPAICFGGESSSWKAVPVGEAWAGHPVGFVLITEPPHQFVGFYRDSDRRLMVAQRRLGSDEWTLTGLDTQVGWDSHNSIKMALDGEGHLHVSGNMHNHPLRYWRSTRPYDATSLERREAMVGSLEDSRVTYPRFVRLEGGKLLFSYRYGQSGSGNMIYNVYDPETATWTRLADGPLVDGEGRRNAYIIGPTLGPDGRWHMAWMWRRTADVQTNSRVSYAVSDDLREWETSAGEPLEIPITYDTCEVVDPTGESKGLHNSRLRIGFDVNNRIVLSYHKYDAKGHSQVYNATPNGTDWDIANATNWDHGYRWKFGGRGSAPSLNEPIDFGPVKVDGGELTQTFHSPIGGNERWRLDRANRAVERIAPEPETIPAEIAAPRVGWNGDPPLVVHWAEGEGRGPDGQRYFLRWETLPANRDRPYEEYPESTPLVVVELPAGE